MNHTSGNWIAKSRPTGGYNIVATDDVLEDVVIGTAVLGDFSLEQAHANAQVMAAGPTLVETLSAAVGYLMNAKIDLDTGAPKATAARTIEGGIKMIRETLAKLEIEP